MRFFLLIPVLFVVVVRAQVPIFPGVEVDNLVPNPGFELLDRPPVGWFLSGRDFNAVIKYWESPTGASPDVYGPDVKVPTYWAEKGFGHRKPRSGERMVGITMFGCDGKPHCREYIRILLTEPLVVGQRYYLEFWVTPLENATAANNIGAAFVTEAKDFADDRLLRLRPVVHAEQIIAGQSNKWFRVKGEFTAKEESEYMLIGNFYPDTLTSFLVKDASLPYGYYYIDDVLLKKVPPVLPIPIKPNDISKQVMISNKTYVLPNVYYEFDQAELLPRSVSDLNKLIRILDKHPAMVIQINGHTDSIGTEDYNLKLSADRAVAVKTYLEAAGVDPKRLLWKGFGEAVHVSTNSTDRGRQLNRRVEFTVITL
jgi:outer membrane protein OmpA-like peptidoglycan-associated protein